MAIRPVPMGGQTGQWQRIGQRRQYLNQTIAQPYFGSGDAPGEEWPDVSAMLKIRWQGFDSI